MFNGEGKGELIKAFVAAQQKFDVPKRSKTVSMVTRSGAKFEFKYAPLDEIIAATRPALAEQGLACFNNVTMPGENIVAVSCVLVHSSGQSHETDPVIFHVDSDPKSAGGAITYGRRYTMSALLGIASEEDTDAPENRQQQKAQQPRAQSSTQDEKPDAAKKDQPITDAQRERLQRIVKEAGVKGADMKAYLENKQIVDSAHITQRQYAGIVKDVQGGKVPKAAAAKAE